MKKLHLICNAHVDPVWLWTWDEGISSAIATFKSAVELADEFEYIFCHNESMLYEAIEECAPELFEKIKKLVACGKWKIVGGWYLQPDCNMLSGETFIRQISVGKSYFKEKFGAEPTVALNFDSFGHSAGLPQILKKNGYNGYMICRPRTEGQFKYPGRFFKWTSPDGSSVIATNSESYGTHLGKAAQKIKDEANRIPTGMLGSEAAGDKKATGCEDVDYSLWGVGNHGGGPSRKDLRDIAALEIEDTEIIHSTPEALFSDDIHISGEVNRSLVTVMPGCYSSMAKVKQGFRACENLLYSTEKMIAVAKNNGIEFDLSELEKAQKKILFATFHDILPGTSVEEGEREALCALYYAERVLREYRTKVFLRLSSSCEKAKPGDYPVFAFNFSQEKTTAPIEAEFTLENQNWDNNIRYVPHVYKDGVEIPSQTIKEASTLNLDWRKRVVFQSELEPTSLTRFEIRVTPDPRKPIPLAVPCDISKYMDKPVFEICDDTADPWGMSDAELLRMGTNPQDMRPMTKDETVRFCAVKEGIEAERIIEDGVILTSYEGLYTNGNSNVVMQVKDYKNLPFKDIKIIAEFAEKNKMLKVRIPLPEEFKDSVSVGDGPFLFEQKPDCENTFQKWIGAQRKDGKIYAVINDGVYSGRVENGYIYLTLLRGAGYSFHPICDLQLYPEDRYLPRIDCGRYTFNIRLFAGDISEVYKKAEEFNQPVYAVNVFPIGNTEKTYDNVKLEGNAILTNFHLNDKGEYIARIYNPTDLEQPWTLKAFDVKVAGSCSKGEVVSVVIKDGIAQVVHDKMPV